MTILLLVLFRSGSSYLCSPTDTAAASTNTDGNDWSATNRSSRYTLCLWNVCLQFKLHLVYKDWNTSCYNLPEVLRYFSSFSKERNNMQREHSWLVLWPKTSSHADAGDPTWAALVRGQTVNHWATVCWSVLLGSTPLLCISLIYWLAVSYSNDVSGYYLHGT